MVINKDMSFTLYKQYISLLQYKPILNDSEYPIRKKIMVHNYVKILANRNNAKNP